MLHTHSLRALVLAAALAAQPARAAFNEDVPFVATPGSATEAMMEIAAVRAGDHLIDLGSGDGRIVIAAALRGATALGVDNDPGLVALSVERARRAGVAARARFLEQDLFLTDLAAATVVTMYLLPGVNLQLRPSLLALRPGTRIVSHDWDMGDWRPDRTVTLAVPDKAIGVAKSSRVHLWVVPARVEGLWCSAGNHARVALRLRRSYQFVDGEIELAAGSPVAVSGRIDGVSVDIALPGAGGSLRLEASGEALHAREAGAAFAAVRGLAWRRARAGTQCAVR